MGKKHTCRWFGKVFLRKTALNHHMRLHTDNAKSFSCVVCNASFRTESSLMRHLRIHTGDKPYQCQMCDKSFARSSSLTSHIRYIHTKKKPYLCDNCPLMFANKCSLNRHMKRSTVARNVRSVMYVASCWWPMPAWLSTCDCTLETGHTSVMPVRRHLLQRTRIT